MPERPVRLVVREGPQELLRIPAGNGTGPYPAPAANVPFDGGWLLYNGVVHDLAANRSVTGHPGMHIANHAVAWNDRQRAIVLRHALPPEPIPFLQPDPHFMDGIALWQDGGTFLLQDTVGHWGQMPGATRTVGAGPENATYAGHSSLWILLRLEPTSHGTTTAMSPTYICNRLVGPMPPPSRYVVVDVATGNLTGPFEWSNPFQHLPDPGKEMDTRFANRTLALEGEPWTSTGLPTSVPTAKASSFVGATALFMACALVAMRRKLP